MPSDLPILSPEEIRRRSTAEKYGGLFYLGIAGIAVLLALLAWFGIGVYRLRGTFQAIYRLHDSGLDEPARIAAAAELSRDPNLTQRQAWDIALRRDVPPLGRYLVATTLTPEALQRDTRGYVLAVSRSKGWPDWLRFQLARPLAVAAAAGQALPIDLLAELATPERDPFLRAWALYTIATTAQRQTMPIERDRAVAALKDLEKAGGDVATLATNLRDTLSRPRDTALATLSSLATWMESQHPATAAVWTGWKRQAGRVVPGPTAPAPAASAGPS